MFLVFEFYLLMERFDEKGPDGDDGDLVYLCCVGVGCMCGPGGWGLALGVKYGTHLPLVQQFTL